jgi:hypothetical protein
MLRGHLCNDRAVAAHVSLRIHELTSENGLLPAKNEERFRPRTDQNVLKD